MQAIEKVKDKVWRKFVSKNEVKEMLDQYKVISSKFNTGQIEMHVWSELSLNSGFEKTEPQLEDVYFSVVNGIMK